MTDYSRRTSSGNGKTDRNRHSNRETGNTQNSGYNSLRNRRKKQREKERMIRLRITAAAVILIVVAGIFIVRKITGGKQNRQGSSVLTTTSASTDIKLKSSVTINDVDITGMDKTKAKAAVLSKFTWGMTAKLETSSDSASSGTAKKSADQNVYQISNLLEKKLDKILTEIFAASGKPNDVYSIDSSGMESEITAEAAAIAKKWNTEAKNGAVSGYDKASNAFVYTDSVDGRTVDQNKVISDIKAAMDAKDYSASISVKPAVKKAELSKDAAKAKYKVIGTFTTKATANADRNNNLKLACEAVDGKILQVGEEFSFNSTTGNRTVEKGYKPAGAYQNGKVVLEPGGGVCQVSSTLYNAVIACGMTTTERHAHTFAPTYVTPGEDATVSYDGYAGPDMRFKNSTSSAIAIRASYHDQTVTVSIIGIPILEDGVTVSMHSEKTNDYDNAATEYVEDPAMVPGTETVIDEGTQGSRWVTNLVKKKNGKVISDEFFHDSTYKGHSKKIARNTSGVQQTGAAAETLTITENTDTVSTQAGTGSAKKTTATTAETATVAQGPGVKKTTTAAAKTTAKTAAAATTTSAKAADSTKSSDKSTQATVETVPPAPGG
jgi:vancomycin resistance protein YoaR